MSTIVEEIRELASTELDHVSGGWITAIVAAMRHIASTYGTAPKDLCSHASYNAGDCSLDEYQSTHGGPWPY
jgi:hypothetical protein